MNVKEVLLDLQNLKGQTRWTDLFISVCAAADDIKLPWSKVRDDYWWCTYHSWWTKWIVDNDLQQSQQKRRLHHYSPCIIHQQALGAKCLKFDHVMKPMVKAINSFHSKALYHCKFNQLLLDILAEYGDVVYHGVAQLGSCTAPIFLSEKKLDIFWLKRDNRWKNCQILYGWQI